MKDLELVGNEEITIDSREIAEMVDTTHSKIIRKLEGDKTHVGIIPVLNEAHLGVVDFFIESSYEAGNGEYKKCYKFTELWDCRYPIR